MHLKILFAMFATLGLSACGKVKPFPDVDYCSGVYNPGFEPYAYCVSYYESKSREYQVSSVDVFKRKYVMLSPEHFGEIKKYTEYLQKEAEKRCQ